MKLWWDWNVLSLCKLWHTVLGQSCVYISKHFCSPLAHASVPCKSTPVHWSLLLLSPSPNQLTSKKIEMSQPPMSRWIGDIDFRFLARHCSLPLSFICAKHGLCCCICFYRKIALWNWFTTFIPPLHPYKKVETLIMVLVCSCYSCKSLKFCFQKTKFPS